MLQYLSYRIKENREKRNVKQMVKMVRRHMAFNHWTYKQAMNAFLLTLGIEGQVQACVTWIYCHRNGMDCTAICPFHAKQDRYDHVADYISKINFGISWGKFEFDYESGEVRVRVFLPTIGKRPTQTEVSVAIYQALDLMQTYGDGLLAAIMGEENAETGGSINNEA